MALFIRFLNRNGYTLFDLETDQTNIEYGLNASTRWSASVFVVSQDIDQLYQGLDIEIWFDGSVVFEGILQRFSPKLSNTNTIDVSGHSHIDDLYQTNIKPVSFYTDTPLLGAAEDLLMDTDFRLGDISTMNNPAILISKDLRGERNLLTQFKSLVEGVPLTYTREGVTILGIRRIDLGQFAQDSGVQLVQIPPENYTIDDYPSVHLIQGEVTYDYDVTEVLRGVRLEGGRVTTTGGSRVIDLGDALWADSTAMFNTDYPIIEDAYNSGYVLLNHVQFPYPGGVIYAAHPNIPADGVDEIIVGDSQGGGTDVNGKFMIGFTPYPGVLKSFTLWWGGHDASNNANINSSNLQLVLFELDPAGAPNLTLVGSPLLDYTVPFGTTYNYNAGKNRPWQQMYTYDFESLNILLEPGKWYGIGVEWESPPTPDIMGVYLRQPGTAEPDMDRSRTYMRYRGSNSRFAGGDTVSQAARKMYLRVETLPLDPDNIRHTSITTIKQPKYAPPRTGSSATNAEIQNAGVALYNYGVASLLDQSRPRRVYKVTTAGTPNIPKVGDTVHMRADAVLYEFDPITKRQTQKIYDYVDEDLRITNLVVTYQGNDIQIRYSLLDDVGVNQLDRMVALYEEIERREPPEGSSGNHAWGLELDPITTVITGVAPDTTMADGRDAKMVTMSVYDGLYTAIHAWTETVFLGGLPIGVSAQGDVAVEMVTDIDYTNGVESFTFKIAFTHRGWSALDSATITAYLVWR